MLAPGQLVYLEPLADDHWRLAQQPAVAGALVAIDPTDGAIVAVTGGFAFFDSRYNRALQARRQPGSAFKPFLYSAALERGFTPATLVNDAPIVIEGGTPEEEWRPQNITKRFYGPTPMREGLVRSRNLVSIRLLRGTGLGHAIKHIGQFGFGAEAMPANLTLALGTGQVTPLAMARGFAVFANGGYLVTPYAVERVTDADGNTVFQATPKLACPACVQATGLGAVATGPVPPDRQAPVAITPANAFVMTDMMVDVIQRGTAQLARSIGRLDLAGKTGTTNDRRDAWFVGYNADLTVATWIGFDQERSLGEQEEGARTALPMWVHFMTEALRGVPEHRQPEPPGVVRMWVSRDSGAPASAGEFGAVFEAFLAAHAPLSGGVVDGGLNGRHRCRKYGARLERGVYFLSARVACTCVLPLVLGPSAQAGALPMSRRPNPRADLLRQAVADEAARIMNEQGVDDFLLAKRKAAERLGVTDASILPRNTEIEAALMAHHRLFAQDRHAADLSDLRRSALAAMRLMQDFQPRLVGPVLNGSASAHSEINLHLFSETPEAVSLRLDERGVPHEVLERRVRFERDRAVSYPALRFVAGRQTVDAVVFPLDGIRQSPCSPVDGKPMRRASATEVEDLLDRLGGPGDPR